MGCLFFFAEIYVTVLLLALLDKRRTIQPGRWCETGPPHVGRLIGTTAVTTQEWRPKQVSGRLRAALKQVNRRFDDQEVSFDSWK
jgi:hypothetical protein